MKTEDFPETREWLNYRHPNRIHKQDEGRKEYFGTQSVLSFVEKELSLYLNRSPQDETQCMIKK